MIDRDRANKFVDKVKTMTDNKELAWSKTLSHRKEVWFKASIENEAYVVIDSYNDRIGLEIPSYGSPIWLSAEEMRLRHLIESIFKSRKMPDHISSWLDKFLKD